MAAHLAALLCVLAAVGVAGPAAAQSRVSRSLNKPCSEQDSCYFVSLQCKEGTCVCAEGFHQYRNTCLAGVGWTCNTRYDCVPGAKCDWFGPNHKYCKCEDGTTKNDDGSRCDGEEIVPGSSCQRSSDCVDGALCDPRDGQCRCTDGKRVVDGSCLEERGLGAECVSPGVRCYTVTNPRLVECSSLNQTCACVEHAVLSADGMFCESSEGARVAASLLALAWMFAITRLIYT